MLYLAVTLAFAQTPFPSSPETQLAAAVAETVGATSQKLAVIADPSLAEADATRLREALGRTGLFTLVERTDAQAVAEARRLEATVLLTLVDATGKRLLVRSVAWPHAALEPTSEPAPESSDTYPKVLEYRRKQVSIHPTIRGAVSPSVMVGESWRSPFWPSFNWSVWGSEPVPSSTAPNDWVVLRGKAEVLSDQDLAELAGDLELKNRIADERFWPRVYWGVGSGLGAAVSTTAGVVLLRRHDRDSRAIGVSLIGVGIAAAAMALLAPNVGGEHAISAGEAQRLADLTNESTRKELGLAPDDLQRYPQQ